MRKMMLAVGFLSMTSGAFAEAPGGPDCGWGNMLFAGESGLPIHLLATITNGTSGNNTFGMTSGTNGCSANGVLTYGGSSLVNLTPIMDEFSEDVARGHGDALTTVAVALEVKQEDRARFNQVMHDNFNQLFPSENVTAEQVMQSVIDVMKTDTRLSKYAA
ncbi:DUF3015 domain-containing protein [Hahella sp. CR1]|uniref:DUF3015 domain-containing protein n=1 Tax=unclassified Hahella TaxID=2624107 RepID=UPI002441E3B7|nr:DUF3015 domain-containing protein [Hahella sp. CR1]MDG9670008.1 DUF3015 domain-containing protein [Hahella sp. CR1]